MGSKICPCCKQPVKHFQAEGHLSKYDEKYNQRNRELFGTFKGHSEWDLAVAWFQTDNDTFYKIFGFNFVPKGKLFDLAKSYVFYSNSNGIPLQHSAPNSNEGSMTLGNSINVAADSSVDREKIENNISEQISRMLRKSIGGNGL